MVAVKKCSDGLLVLGLLLTVGTYGVILSFNAHMDTAVLSSTDEETGHRDSI